MQSDNQTPPQAHEDAASAEPAQAETPPAEESEFRLTIKKLELPVRPRGVLAE